MSDFEIRRLTAEEMEQMISNAVDGEGWTESYDVLHAFRVLDHDGFLGGFIEGKLIGHISCVRWPENYGFVGYYIVIPEYRGKGYGMKLWNAGMKHLEGCNVGLDGVIEEVPLYLKSGFKEYFENTRWEGISKVMPADSHIIRYNESMIDQIAEYDRKCFPSERKEFLKAWLTVPHGHSVVYMDNGVIVFAGNLGLRNAPMAEELSKRLGMHTVVLNDADAAAYGEVVAGAARGAASAVTITLGTGVGCGVVLPGGVIRPGEGGHMVIVYDGEPCTCGRKGCFEAYASATALIRQTKIAMVKAPQSRLWEVCGGELENVAGKTLFDALALGDATAKEVFDAYVHYVACGITNIVNLVQPEMVCVGGGISGAGEILLAPLRKLVQADQFPMGDGRVTRIEVCQLGNDAGIIGAALFARQ